MAAVSTRELQSKRPSEKSATAVHFLILPIDSLDNYSAHSIRIWGQQFPTVEHAYQWRKLERIAPGKARAILRAKSPNAAKSISRRYLKPLPKTWDEEKVVIMEQLLRAKARQHPDVRDVLAQTRHKLIVEASDEDSFWGIGPSGGGKNMLGVIWMKIREDK